jgi:hypothetical protein
MEYLHNNQERINEISQFMDELLNNNIDTKVEIYKKYETVIKSVTPMDIFYLNMYKQNSNFSIAEIKGSADKFVNVFHLPLQDSEIKDYNHDFFRLLYLESQAIEDHLKKIKQLIRNRNMNDIEKKEFYEEFKKCEAINKKFIKIENILFPHIEDKLPSVMPIKVLWELHDDARKTLKSILDMLSNKIFDLRDLYITIGEYYFLIYGINQKEQLILNPVAVKLLSNQELDKMYNEMLEYGFAFIEEDYSVKKVEGVNMSNLKNQIFNSETGELKLTELEIILNILPVDITFVDVHNQVKYFNNTKHRVFPRNPSIIGRDVKNCHPQKSVAIVERIIDSFKNGNKDTAEFWLNFNNSMIYITYLALRDNQNKYIGVLEISQDITNLRALQGERRLLDWK